MNRHFKRDFDDRVDLPASVFGRVDHVVTSGPPDNIVLIAFDAIDAQWLDNQAINDPRFNINDPVGVATAWKATRLKAPSLFESAPLFRIEVELDVRTKPFGLPFLPDYDCNDANTGAQALEEAWFRFEVSETHRLGFTPALIYPGLFAPPIAIFVQGTMPTPVHANALAGIFSLQHFPKISVTGLRASLKKACAKTLAVYDVGQGNANALLDKLPSLYFDLGAGVYRNKKTTPANLRFCFTKKPKILLSHWDADHWAGAYETATGTPPAYLALQREWIAPLQTVGPLHIAFANDIIAHGGSLQIYNPAAGTVDRVTLANNTELRLGLGSGSGRNDSGIVAVVENSNLNPSRTWVLTGDCSYTHISPSLAPNNPIAVVVPHHGANLYGGAAAPNPFRGVNGYCRLLYSFGADNAHGNTGVRHPTLNTATLNIGARWSHGTWHLPAPGNAAPSPADDIRVTARHTVAGAAGTNLGGILVGWNSLPTVLNSPCNGLCSTTPVQS